MNSAIDTILLSAKVVSGLEQLIEWREKPEKTRAGQQAEFIAEKLKDWCCKNEITLYYIQPEKPSQNSLVERFNGTFRTEFLDAYLFNTIGYIVMTFFGGLNLNNLYVYYYKHSHKNSFILKVFFHSLFNFYIFLL